jgi:hypothetical protein
VIRRAQQIPAIMDEVLQTMGRDIQGRGIERVLVLVSGGALRTQDLVDG